MPGRAHHSDKWHRCVEEVRAKGDVESPEAVCTAQLGDESYVSLEAKYEVEGRELHLLGAVGKVRTELYEGREHLVVPLIALMEGVIHAVNSPIPEFVPADVVTNSPHEWNGRPVVVYHPTKGGRQCSANDPRVFESHRVGTIFGAYSKDAKLGMEAWVDPARLEALGQTKLLADLRSGNPVEVSVGAFVRTEMRVGEHKGKPYKAIWRDKTSDHLALLPGKKGACSLEMGCGTHRAAENLPEEPHVYEVTETGFRAACEKPAIETIDVLFDTWAKQYETLMARSTEELRAAIGRRHSAGDQSMLQTMHDNAVALGAECSPKTMESKYKDCPTCDGMGQVEGKDCPTCEGEGKVVAGKMDRYTEQNAAIVPQLKAACRCEEKKTMSMTKDKRAELIAALVTDNKYSGFKEGDEPFLETASDERLEEFRSASEGRKTFDVAHNKLETDQRNVAAKLKVAEEKLRSTEEQLKTAQQKPTKEQWLADAPAEIKALLEQEEKRNTEHRTSLVMQLKAAQSEFNEEDLNAMDITMLERLSRTVKVEVPDFSGREFPHGTIRHAARKEDTNDYAPPNPYEAGIKALQAKIN